jgi:hypothetical protein
MISRLGCLYGAATLTLHKKKKKKKRFARKNGKYHVCLMLKHSGLPRKFLDCKKNKSFFKLLCLVLPTRSAMMGFPPVVCMSLSPPGYCRAAAASHANSVGKIPNPRFSHRPALVSCHGGAEAPLLHPSLCRLSSSTSPLLFCHHPCTRGLAATALSGMVYTDLLPLLPLESMLLPWLLYHPPLHPHAKPLNIRRRSKSTITIPKWDTATSLQGEGEGKQRDGKWTEHTKAEGAE